MDNEAAFTGVMVDGYDTSDTNRNESPDEEVWTYDMDADQATLSETVNTYAIILGQAQVVKSVTTSDAAKLVGEIGGDWEDGGGGRCDEPIARVEPQCDDSAVWVQPSGTVGERDRADGERAKPECANAAA
ncbi:MAG: hypothetical protein IPL32_20555 [Chloracidobacterium sp.]|nr:hypothetical protein [Chloracidobacterium sp.]